MIGGTIDISVHRVAADDKVDSIIAPLGGPCGGNVVNASFQRLLEQVLGNFQIGHCVIKVSRTHHYVDSAFAGEISCGAKIAQFPLNFL